jgi:hypothetical protein
MAKYRKKPVAIEAVQWIGGNISEICNFTGRCGGDLIKNGELYITTLEGVHRASVGDFIIKGVKGEFYPCKPDIFAQTYEPADTVEVDNCDGCYWKEKVRRPSRCSCCRRNRDMKDNYRRADE